LLVSNVKRIRWSLDEAFILGVSRVVDS